MSFDTPSGTYGLPMTGNRLEGWLDRMMASRLARKVFGRLGFHVLVLTTVGRRTGKERHSQVCWWPAPDGSWYVVAAAGGTRINPAWYHNLAAHPDRVWIDLDGRTVAVTAQQVHGPEREAAWRQIVTADRRFGSFQAKTDRQFPVIRLVPRTTTTSRAAA